MTARSETSQHQVCAKFGSAQIDGGRYLVQNDEWGSDDGQCVTATTTGFTVDRGAHHQTDGPAAFPSIVTGCWMGTCTTGTALPRRIADLGRVSSNIRATIPADARTDLAYDLWADPGPRKDGANTAAEIMIWLARQGGVDPLGTKTDSVTVSGATWDVWKGTNNGVDVVSYVRTSSTTTATDLPLTDFLENAVVQGSVSASDYLTNIQAGFEPWEGGPGLAITDFSVQDDGAASGSGAETTTASDVPPAASSTSLAAPSTTSPTPAGSTPSSRANDSSTAASWSMKGGLAGFQSTPWNVQDAEAPTAASSPSVPGRQAIKFALPGGGRRSEVQPAFDTFDAGTTYFGYSAYLDSDFAVDARSWQVIFQLHDGGTNGSPPVALEIGDGRLWFANAGNDHDRDLGPVVAGQTLDVQMRVSFEGAGKGTISIWRDGRAVLSDYAPPRGTMVDGSDYLKIGIYRDPSESRPSTLYLDDLRIGPTFASVSHLVGATSASQRDGGDGRQPDQGSVVLGPSGLLAAKVMSLRRRRRRTPHRSVGTPHVVGGSS